MDPGFHSATTHLYLEQQRFVMRKFEQEAINTRKSMVDPDQTDYATFLSLFTQFLEKSLQAINLKLELLHAGCLHIEPGDTPDGVRSCEEKMKGIFLQMQPQVEELKAALARGQLNAYIKVESLKDLFTERAAARLHAARTKAAGGEAAVTTSAATEVARNNSQADTNTLQQDASMEGDGEEQGFESMQDDGEDKLGGNTDSSRRQTAKARRLARTARKTRNRTASVKTRTVGHERPAYRGRRF